MNYLKLICLIFLTTQAQAAQLGEVARGRVKDAIDRSALLITTPSFCPGIHQPSAELRERILADRSGLNTKDMEDISMSAGASSYFLTVSGIHDYQITQAYRNPTPNRVALSSIVGGGVSSALAASNSTGATKKVIKDLRVINEDALERNAREFASRYTKIFSLRPSQEAALRGAIKSEVVKKINKNDLSDLNLMDLALGTTASGKPLLDKKQELLVKHAKDLNESAGVPKENGKLAKNEGFQTGDDTFDNALKVEELDDGKLLLALKDVTAVLSGCMSEMTDKESKEMFAKAKEVNLRVLGDFKSAKALRKSAEKEENEEEEESGGGASAK
jgi:hypothetical protein